jgi:hypothetical protein
VGAHFFQIVVTGFPLRPVFPFTPFVFNRINGLQLIAIPVRGSIGATMSSDRRTLSSRANGRRAKGPVTAVGKLRSSQNALRHGLLARCLVLEDESPEAFQALLAQHLDRLQPVDGLEFGMIEEMVAASWRMRRAWAIETHMIDTVAAGPDPSATPIDSITTAFSSLAASSALPLMHRYETRLHMVYQRALHNLLMLRAAIPNEPSPISEHPAADLKMVDLE